tara:strand:- start:776 stop:1744 length:969 start_codon:yes stop_codon:yes gene_type:complete
VSLRFQEVIQKRWFQRLALSFLFLFGVFQFVDTDALFKRIASLDLVWLIVALVVTLPQYYFSAERWRLTAGRLGAHLSRRAALSEYYFGSLVNQILPGGVLGDAGRALRHGHSLRSYGESDGLGMAARAVIFERASGQIVLFVFMLIGFFFWPTGSQEKVFSFQTGLSVLLFVMIFLILIYVLIKGVLKASSIGQFAIKFFQEARYTLLAGDVIFKQLSYSLIVLASYLFCFYCAAQAIDIEIALFELVALVPVVLFSMTIPITIAGWGVREASAAAIWGLAELPVVDGVAISVTYGIIVLISALPGIFFVISSKNNLKANH